MLIQDPGGGNTDDLEEDSKREKQPTSPHKSPQTTNRKCPLSGTPMSVGTSDPVWDVGYPVWDRGISTRASPSLTTSITTKQNKKCWLFYVLIMGFLLSDL